MIFLKLVHFASICMMVAQSNFYQIKLKNTEVGNHKVNQTLGLEHWMHEQSVNVFSAQFCVY